MRSLCSHFALYLRCRELCSIGALLGFTLFCYVVVVAVVDDDVVVDDDDVVDGAADGCGVCFPLTLVLDLA